MHTKAIPFVIAVLSAFAALGQPPAQQDVDRTFHFANTDTVQGMQEIATAIRAIADIPSLTVDTTQRTLILHGTAGQAALADWLFNDLDKPANLPPHQTPVLPPPQYPFPANHAHFLRVFFLT